MGTYFNPLSTTQMNFLTASSILLPPLKSVVSRRMLSRSALMRAAESIFPNGYFEASSTATSTTDSSLDVLLTCLQEEAQLGPLGLYAASQRLVSSIVKRRQLNAYLDENPTIKDNEIKQPIVIVGFPRSGTTLLHNLFASDPTNRTVQLWEMRDPFIDDEKKIKKSIRETEKVLTLTDKYAPKLKNIHPTNAYWPDECNWLLRNNFANLIYSVYHYMPSYVDWLHTKDMTEDYQLYRKQLQVLLHLRPGNPLILKDPCHIWSLEQLTQALPGVKIIHLHRQMEESLASFCSMNSVLHEIGSTRRSLPEIGEYCLKIIETGMQKMLAARKVLPEDQFIDISYKKLVSDPINSVKCLYEKAELDYQKSSLDGMTHWLETNKNKTGKHYYDLHDFGLKPSMIKARFEPYHQQFRAFL